MKTRGDGMKRRDVGRGRERSTFTEILRGTTHTEREVKTLEVDIY